MRCIVHDYAGHPFQVSLSRHLAKRGHDVTHLYFADYPGPKGIFEERPDDPPLLRFIGITIEGAAKQATRTRARFARRFGDLAYGRAASRIIQSLNPDVVLSGNTPTEAQRAILRTCKMHNVRFIYWLQDIYSVAVSKLLSKELGYTGVAIGWYYRCLDRSQFRASDAIVSISQDFVPLAASWAGDYRKISVIENWAAIDEIKVGVKDNDWSREQGLHDKFAFIYSGTLGRKHNFMLLARLARQCRSDESLVVTGHGQGIPSLAKAAQGVDALKLLPIQPAKQFPKVLATADVLIATIEADSSTFAVPSKVLSYLCASRPILLAAPKENLASRIIEKANAGIVVDPADEIGFLTAADRLRADPQLRRDFGTNGRAYAERTFDMARIADKFETVLEAQ